MSFGANGVVPSFELAFSMRSPTKPAVIWARAVATFYNTATAVYLGPTLHCEMGSSPRSCAEYPQGTKKVLVKVGQDGFRKLDARATAQLQGSKEHFTVTFSDIIELPRIPGHLSGTHFFSEIFPGPAEQYRSNLSRMLWAYLGRREVGLVWRNFPPRGRQVRGGH